MKHGIRHNNQEIQARNKNKTRNMLKKAINHVIQAKGRLGIRTIPCVFGEERRIKKL